jgi:hypothetical protein
MACTAGSSSSSSSSSSRRQLQAHRPLQCCNQINVWIGSVLLTDELLCNGNACTSYLTRQLQHILYMPHTPATHSARCSSRSSVVSPLYASV